jgi:hypothetical protein
MVASQAARPRGQDAIGPYPPAQRNLLPSSAIKDDLYTGVSLSASALAWQDSG